eukprot:2529023-Prorocentrum_lima.AAC.1
MRVAVLNSLWIPTTPSRSRAMRPQRVHPPVTAGPARRWRVGGRGGGLSRGVREEGGGGGW